MPASSPVPVSSVIPGGIELWLPSSFVSFNAYVINPNVLLASIVSRYNVT